MIQKSKVLSKKSKLLLFLIVISLNFSYAQRTVSGSVTEATNGDPLIGATVFIPDTKIRTSTDIQGFFSLEIPEEATQLTISHGADYTTQTVNVGTANGIDVVLHAKVLIGYGTQKKEAVTSAITEVSAPAFNQGVIADPALLLQGKVAGLQIYNRGGNPNRPSRIRLRGLSSGGLSQPLIVIDGVIGASLQNVDPNDIERFTVLKDAAAAAIYGTRGSDGVIIVTTKKGQPTKKMQWSYNGQLTSESAVNTISNMTASEFIAAGGNDLGAETDWIDAITESPISHNHHVAVAGGIGKKSSMRLSANYRDKKGILKNTGFGQFNTRLNFATSAFKDKLKIEVNTAYTDRTEQNGYEEAFRYAVYYNPTAPILGENAPFPFDSERYGGFFETLGLFDSFNPVSIVTQNERETQQKEFNFGANIGYAVNDKLTLNLRVARQRTDVVIRALAPTTALFLGNAASPILKGIAEFREVNGNFSLTEIFGTYSTDFSKGNLQFTAGYSYRQNDLNSRFFKFGDFQNNDLNLSNLDINSLIEPASSFTNAGLIEASSSKAPTDKNIAFFGRANLNFGESIFVNASFRNEPSAILKVNTKIKRRWFPAFGVGVDLNKYWEASNLDLFKVRMNYGITGTARNYFLPTYFVFTGQGGGVSIPSSLGGGVNLVDEKKATLNLGVELASGRFSSILDIYNRNISNFISERIISQGSFSVDRQFGNVGDLNTKGVELALNYEVIKTTDKSYNTGIVLSTYKTILREYIVPSETRGNLGSPGQNGTNVNLLKEGTEIGNIWGPVYTGVDAIGEPIFKDVNGDGQLLTGQDKALDEEVDFEVLGNGIPDLELGWTNQLRLGNWSINAFFRGAFGHSLVNVYRAFYESQTPIQSSYNYINTDLAVPELKTPRFSSLYVEKADFFKLDNLTISKQFDIEKSKLRAAQVSLTVMNAFVLTKYTGNSPEPSLVDSGVEDMGDLPIVDVFSSGIDRRNNYFTARSVVFGLNLTF